MPGQQGPVGAAQRAATKFIVFEKFEKMNTQSIRQALAENELAWLENLQPIAPNNLAAVPAPAKTPIATILENATFLYYADIAGVDYVMAFTSAGAGFAINIATGNVSQFAPDGTFSNPDVTTWQAQRVLINDPTAGYCTFDGTIFVRQGNVSPVFAISNGGSGYSSAPSVTISGGSGHGATAHSVIQQGVVVAVILDNPGVGYQVGDTLAVAFGTGVGSGATGHVTMTGFNVSAVGIINGGQYGPSDVGPGLYPLSFTGGGGVGAAGHVTMTLGGNNNFFVANPVVTNGGSGYTSAPSVSVVAPGGGPNAVLTSFLGTEAVASIVLDTGGSLYVAPPNVSIQGGAPSTAATAHATLSGGAVNALVLDTAGAGYTSTPLVIIGTGTGAVATAHVWPFVPAGTTLAVYQGRVWLGGGQLLQYTGTQGYDDFNSANAAGSLNITDADLIHAITALRAANNYLFILGDASIKQIGNISLNSAGTATLFTILTLSSDQGTIYPRSCIAYERIFLFANSNGVYAVFGSSVQKISDDMDGIFSRVDFSQQPQAALADIKSQHYVVYLVRYKDPVTATTRSILVTFTGKKWFVMSQGDSLTTVTTAELLATGDHLTIGSSGMDITQLLADATVPVSFRWQTSLSHHGNAVQRKKTIRAGYAVTSTGAGTITVALDSDEGSSSDTHNLVDGFQARAFSRGETDENVGVSGRYLGLTVTGKLAGFIGSLLSCEYQETNVGNKN
jgi:hypothetical protein